MAEEGLKEKAERIDPVADILACVAGTYAQQSRLILNIG